MIDGVTVVGPFDSPGVSKTAQPRTPLHLPAAAGPTEKSLCARTIIENLARRAFRRPVTKDDVDSLMPYFEARAREGTGRV